MSVPRGVSLCALKNESLPINSTVRDQTGPRSSAVGRSKLTVDVQLVDFSLDRHRLLCLSRDELGFDGLDQARADRVELDGKVRNIHLHGFAVRLVVYVLLSTTESGGLTLRDELVQLFRGCRREVDKPLESKLTAQS
jgi:hypothetical protein